MEKAIWETIASIAGITCLIAYGLVSSKRIRAEGWPYNLTMLLVGVIYFAYATYMRAYAMIFLQVFFVGISTRVTWKDIFKPTDPSE